MMDCKHELILLDEENYMCNIKGCDEVWMDTQVVILTKAQHKAEQDVIEAAGKYRKMEIAKEDGWEVVVVTKGGKSYDFVEKAQEELDISLDALGGK